MDYSSVGHFGFHSTAPYNAEENILLFMFSHPSQCLLSVSFLGKIALYAHFRLWFSVAFCLSLPTQCQWELPFHILTVSFFILCYVWTEYFLCVRFWGLPFLGWAVPNLSCSMWNLLPDQDWTLRLPALGARSLSHCTTREFPQCSFHLYLYYFYKGWTSLLCSVFLRWEGTLYSHLWMTWDFFAHFSIGIFLLLICSSSLYFKDEISLFWFL